MPDGLVLLDRFYVNPSLLLDHEYQRGDGGAVRLVLKFRGGITMEATGAAVAGVARSLGLPESPFPGPTGEAASSGAIWCHGGDPRLLEAGADGVRRE
jgi:hypothetical protein